MKKSIFATIVIAILTLVATAVAFPTVILKTDNGYIRIRGAEPKDYKPDLLIQEFSFVSSLDLSGGNISTFNVDLSTIDKEYKQEVLQMTKDIMNIRLLSSRFTDYQISTFANAEKDDYKIVVKYPDSIDPMFVQTISTPGHFGLMIEDSSIPEDSEDASNNPYGNRKYADLSNEDIESVVVISDSRCYFQDENKPLNYCIKITFKKESQPKFISVLYENPVPKYPMLVMVDGSPIGVQAAGQVYNAGNVGTELLVYTITDDSYIANILISSILSSPSIEASVFLEDTSTLAPIFGDFAMQHLKIGYILSFLLGNALILYYFRKRSWFLIICNYIFLAWSVAALKLFTLPLSFPVMMGYLLSFVMFLFFLIMLVYKLRTSSKSGLLEEEALEDYSRISRYYRNITIMVILFYFVVVYTGTLMVVNFFTSFGIGIVIGYAVYLLAVKYFLPIFFFPKLKWQT